MKNSPIRYSHPGLKYVQTYQPGKPIEELERELGIKGAMKMASNENPYGPSPKALTAMKKNLGNLHRYPDADSYYLKKALSKKFGISASRIALGNGSDELIVLAMKAFVPRGGEILTAKPTFLIYRIAGLVSGAKVKEVPMHRFRYDLNAMKKQITKKTRMICIANPDNPVGTYLSHKELSSFIQSVPRRCLIFLDEAYYEYAKSKKDYPKSFTFLKYPNVIISRTFSKAYGLSGLRIGYAFGSPHVIDGLNKVREPFNVNAMAQAAALAALKDNQFLKKVIRSNDREKKKIYTRMEKLGLEAIPSVTNFILIKVGKRSKYIYNRLLSKGVIVRRMNVWGLDEFIRVTVGKPKENNRFLKILESMYK